jgi:hypothetical protein
MREVATTQAIWSSAIRLNRPRLLSHGTWLDRPREAGITVATRPGPLRRRKTSFRDSPRIWTESTGAMQSPERVQVADERFRRLAGHRRTIPRATKEPGGRS